MLRILSVILMLGANLAIAQDRGQLEREFKTWLNGPVWKSAKRTGVTQEQFDAALGGVTIDWELPAVDFPKSVPKTQKQSEFSAPGRYFRQKTLQGTARIGRDLAKRHSNTLATVERRTGVPARILMAIWGRESGFGNVGSEYNAYRVLATRGYFGPNADYFTDELVAALRMGDRNGHLKSSWAGAMGQPQMMPTSLLAYGADGDSDGKIDIWNSEADTLASIGKFLADHEWIEGRDWGFEVSLPSSVSCTLEGPDNGRTVQNWESLGVKRVSGRPFPKFERNKVGFLMLPAGRRGPAFIVTPNFYVLKRYNRSDLYALYIGNLGDRIQYGMGDFRTPWQASGGLLRSDISDMQQALKNGGRDVGKVDGIAGYKTRRAIGFWQIESGMAETCYLSIAVRDGLLR